MAVIQPVPFSVELKRNPELKIEDVEKLQDWCKKQPHLPVISDAQLAVFLHSAYYHLQPAKSMIEAYYTYRSHLPEFFSNQDPIECKELRQAMKMSLHMPLKGETLDGYQVFYSRLIDFNASDYVYNNVTKFWNMANDLWLHEKGTMKGHILVFDVEGVGLGHAGKLNLMGLKKYFIYLQEALPIRLKGFHFINSSTVTEIIFNMIKPFMSKELSEIFHIHTTNETLSKFFPVDMLPNECGGKAGPLAELHKKNIKWLEINRKYFLEEEKTQRVNESLRVGKEITSNKLFNFEGSFKKLNID